jgi:hypothetical protein
MAATITKLITTVDMVTDMDTVMAIIIDQITVRNRMLISIPLKKFLTRKLFSENGETTVTGVTLVDIVMDMVTVVTHITLLMLIQALFIPKL